MAYCATGSISVADWNEIKKLCKQMQDLIDEKFRQLDSGAIQTLKSKMTTLETSIDAVKIQYSLMEKRLAQLEEVAANTELTTSEVLDMWRKER